MPTKKKGKNKNNKKKAQKSSLDTRSNPGSCAASTNATTVTTSMPTNARQTSQLEHPGKKSNKSQKGKKLPANTAAILPNIAFPNANYQAKAEEPVLIKLVSSDKLPHPPPPIDKRKYDFILMNEEMLDKFNNDSNYQKAINDHIEEYMRSINSEPVYSNGKADCFSFRAGGKARVINTYANVDGHRCLLLAEDLEEHEYDKSRVLNANIDCVEDILDIMSRKNKEGKKEVCKLALDAPENMPESNAQLKNKFIPMQSYNNQWIVLDDIQNIKLTDVQKNQAGRRLPLIISGPPGSGKTCVAFSLLKQVGFKIFEDDDAEDVLYIVENERLAAAMRKEWTQVQPDSQKHKVKISTYEDLLREETGYQDDFVGEEHFYEWLSCALETFQVNQELNYNRVYQEFRLMAAYTREEYLKPECKSLYHSMEEKKTLYGLLEKYRASLDRENKIDPGLYKFNKLANKYKKIISDETQDFSFLQINQIWEMATKDREIAFCLDTHQSLSDSLAKYSWLVSKIKSCSLVVRDEKEFCVNLPYSYRCSPPIAEMADAAMKAKFKATGGLADKREISHINSVNAPSDNDKPVVWLQEENQALFKKIKDMGPDCAVIFNPVGWRRSEIEEERKKIKKLYNTKLVFTPREIKGFEYKMIVLHHPIESDEFVQANKEFVKAQKERKPEAKEKEKEKIGRPKRNDFGETRDQFAPCFNAFYAAITRAQEELVIVQPVTHGINQGLAQELQGNCKHITYDLTEEVDENSVEKETKTMDADGFRRRAEEMIEGASSLENIYHAREILAEYCAMDSAQIMKFLEEKLKWARRMGMHNLIVHLYESLEGECKENAYQSVFQFLPPRLRHRNLEQSELISLLEETYDEHNMCICNNKQDEASQSLLANPNFASQLIQLDFLGCANQDALEKCLILLVYFESKCNDDSARHIITQKQNEIIQRMLAVSGQAPEALVYDCWVNNKAPALQKEIAFCLAKHAKLTLSQFCEPIPGRLQSSLFELARSNNDEFTKQFATEIITHADGAVDELCEQLKKDHPVALFCMNGKYDDATLHKLVNFLTTEDKDNSTLYLEYLCKNNPEWFASSDNIRGYLSIALQSDAVVVFGWLLGFFSRRDPAVLFDNDAVVLKEAWKKLPKYCFDEMLKMIFDKKDTSLIKQLLDMSFTRGEAFDQDQVPTFPVLFLFEKEQEVIAKLLFEERFVFNFESNLAISELLSKMQINKFCDNMQKILAFFSSADYQAGIKVFEAQGACLTDKAGRSLKNIILSSFALLLTSLHRKIHDNRQQQNYAEIDDTPKLHARFNFITQCFAVFLKDVDALINAISALRPRYAPVIAKMIHDILDKPAANSTHANVQQALGNANQVKPAVTTTTTMTKVPPKATGSATRAIAKAPALSNDNDKAEEIKALLSSETCKRELWIKFFLQDGFEKMMKCRDLVVPGKNFIEHLEMPEWSHKKKELYDELIRRSEILIRNALFSGTIVENNLAESLTLLFYLEKLHAGMLIRHGDRYVLNHNSGCLGREIYHKKIEILKRITDDKLPEVIYEICYRKSSFYKDIINDILSRKPLTIDKLCSPLPHKDPACLYDLLGNDPYLYTDIISQVLKTDNGQCGKSLLKWAQDDNCYRQLEVVVDNGLLSQEWIENTMQLALLYDASRNFKVLLQQCDIQALFAKDASFIRQAWRNNDREFFICVIDRIIDDEDPNWVSRLLGLGLENLDPAMLMQSAMEKGKLGICQWLVEDEGLDFSAYSFDTHVYCPLITMAMGYEDYEMLEWMMAKNNSFDPARFCPLLHALQKDEHDVFNWFWKEAGYRFNISQNPGILDKLRELCKFKSNHEYMHFLPYCFAPEDFGVALAFFKEFNGGISVCLMKRNIVEYFSMELKFGEVLSEHDKFMFKCFYEIAGQAEFSSLRDEIVRVAGVKESALPVFNAMMAEIEAEYQAAENLVGLMLKR